jgi:hypothetical protein
LPDALSAGGAEVFAAAGGELELLLQAAASRASGTRAAAVHAKRIRLATGEYSFTYARLRVRYTTRTRRVR